MLRLNISKFHAICSTGKKLRQVKVGRILLNATVSSCPRPIGKRKSWQRI
ncbi:hypothetical protein V3C99_016378 [Haemonchus contortus]